SAEIHVPKPFGMRAKMFFALLYQMDFPKSTVICHFFCLYVLGCEKELFGIKQQNASIAGVVNHLLGLLNCHGQRFLTYNVLSRSGTICCHLRMQSVWRRNGDHLQVALLEHVAIIREYTRDAISLGQSGGMSRGWRSNGHDLCML